MLSKSMLLLSRFSCVRLCATPEMAAHQAPPSLGSPGKNTGVGCHFLLQCMKVKSESEVAQSCPTLCDPMECSLPGSSVHGILQARTLEWVAISFSNIWKWKVKVKPLSRVWPFARHWKLKCLHWSKGPNSSPQQCLPHVTQPTPQKLNESGYKVLIHLPYSPDLSCRPITTSSSILTTFWRENASTTSRKCFPGVHCILHGFLCYRNKLISHWQKCVDFNDSYFW